MASNRPGGTTCKYCGQIYPYSEMTKISTRQFACDECLDRREKLGVK